ncbi:hypothetical protein [Arcanobacterium canis]
MSTTLEKARMRVAHSMGRGYTKQGARIAHLQSCLIGAYHTIERDMAGTVESSRIEDFGDMLRDTMAQVWESVAELELAL